MSNEDLFTASDCQAPPSGLLSLPAAAARLGVPAATLRDAARRQRETGEGGMPLVVIGCRVKLPARWVESLINPTA